MLVNPIKEMNKFDPMIVKRCEGPFYIKRIPTLDIPTCVYLLNAAIHAGPDRKTLAYLLKQIEEPNILKALPKFYRAFLHISFYLRRKLEEEKYEIN